MSEYYDFSKKHLAGTNIESFATSNDQPGLISMSSNIDNSNLKKNRALLVDDENADFSQKVKNPNGYGYNASLPEVRNKNAMEIIKQEQSILAISAVAGVSLIVLGILISGRND